VLTEARVGLGYFGVPGDDMGRLAIRFGSVGRTSHKQIKTAQVFLYIYIYIYIHYFAIMHLGAFCIENAPTLVATRPCPVATGAHSGCNLFTSGCN
jgi:hypothetical protein